MAKKTLLQITQSILSSMNSDSVNSINDLEESLQVAEKVQEVYEDLMTLKDWEHLQTMIQLESLSDNEKPNYLRLPDGVSEIKDVRYDVRKDIADRKKFIEIQQVNPDDFLEHVLAYNNLDDNVIEVVDPSGITLFCKNNHAPMYWTSFDDEHIVFDSYDSEIDTTLQQSKNLARAVKETVFTLSDDFIPDLPSKMFPTFVQECTRVCSLYFREQPSPNDERRAFRSFATQQNKSKRIQKMRIRNGRK